MDTIGLEVYPLVCGGTLPYCTSWYSRSIPACVGQRSVLGGLVIKWGYAARSPIPAPA